MARYVVVEFTDNADAEEFIQRTNDLNANARKARIPFSRRIVGVFVKPGLICMCSDWAKASDKNWHAVEVLKGEKFGW